MTAVTDSALPDFTALRLTPDALGGRVIGVTGATDGLGRALAVACAAHGAEVILFGRQVRRLETVEREINALARHGAVLAPLDLEQALAGDYDAIAAAIGARFGRLDGLVHAAALLGNLAPVEHCDVPGWCRQLQVNLTAPFALTQVLLPWLRAAPDAAIVFTGCPQVVRPAPYWGGYAASKAGLEALALTLAAEWEAGQGPRVSIVDPGPMRTKLRRQAYPSADLDALPAPEARVAAFLWLLSPQARPRAAAVHGRRIAL